MYQHNVVGVSNPAGGEREHRGAVICGGPDTGGPAVCDRTDHGPNCCHGECRTMQGHSAAPWQHTYGCLF